jgi:glycosyltransferase involved in cell wall biosynthesis
MLGWMDRAEVMNLFTQVRAGLVLFQPAPNHIDSQPNKLFEYMAAGLPIIASYFPSWIQLISKLQCGLVVNPAYPREIATAITWILENPVEAKAMGARGREAVIEMYNWEREATKLLGIYGSFNKSLKD